MKHLNGKYYVEVKDHRYKIHPTENIILGLQDELISLRTQDQGQNETQIRRNQKVIKNINDELVVKNYPKNKQPIQQQPKFKPPDCPRWKRNIWLELDKFCCCQNCNYIFNKQKHQIDKKNRKQDHYFSTRLAYANKKMRETRMNLIKTTYITTEYMINKLRSLKGKKKLKFLKIISNYYDEITIRYFKFEEDPFSKIAQSFVKICHEVLILLNFVQTKQHVQIMIINYYDLYYIVVKNRDDKEKVVDEIENIENDYINFNDFETPNHYIERKNNEILN